jgi:hypothetical protein
MWRFAALSALASKAQRSADGALETRSDRPQIAINVGVTGSIPVAPTIQSSRTAETALNQKQAVSAGILDAYF